jgi:hypothetical protein
MSDEFAKIRNIEYESLKQTPERPLLEEDQEIKSEFEDQELEQSGAAAVVEEYDRTIQFQKFIEGLLRENSKVEVEIDPEDDPEVWMAMTRVFKSSTLSPKLNQDSYFQVIDALEVIERIEQAEDDPKTSLEDDFLENLPNISEAAEGEILDSEFQTEIKNDSVTGASSTESKPPEDLTSLRRWQKVKKKIKVLEKFYPVKWIKKRVIK